jgi:hypothetical protein|tara:strand:- start:39 stop:545 length:507 start_codon:yes stop_codon:yes gene_type:complete
MEDLSNIFEARNVNVFNSPLEIGFRILYILNGIYPIQIDINRLVIYDYFLLNSGDFPNGPKSLHPPIPHRSSQIIIKPLLIKDAIILMQSKELLDVIFSEEGIKYKSNELTKRFIELQENEYSKKLFEISSWINNQFSILSEDKLNVLVKNNIPNWGGEFIYESLIRE